MVAGETLLPHSASVMSSTRRTETPAMYISMRASSTLLSRRRYRSKGRYYEATKRFCAYLATYYHLQKLENVSGKHLVSYVLYLQE